MSGPSVSNLFPAIAQSFAVIIIGYVFGFFKIIAVKDAGSIGTLVGKLALPALLFKNLAILNLMAISWPFLGAMLVSKFTLFAIVALLTAVLSRPFNIGKGGLFGIFVTQSNDFALGLPIVKALYPVATSPDQFDYISYIYLLAPVSLAIINPIGFTFMELNKNISTKKMDMKQIPLILLRTLKGVVFNPVIFMTLLGLIVNVFVSFALNKTTPDDKLPGWLVDFLDVLGGAYAACALFNIGIFMVGKMKKITLNLILVASLLIVAKTILLPILAYRIVYTIVPGVPNITNSTANYSYFLDSSSPLDSEYSTPQPHDVSNATRGDIATFGFLLGTFPTAPTVFVFASQYHLAMETVAASLVLCTFMSAPIMYVAARMVLVPYASSKQYDSIISDVQQDVSIISAICVVLIFALFMFARRYRSYIHVFIMHLMVAIFMEVVSINILNFVRSEELLYWQFFWFSLFFIGVLSTRTWMASISIGLLVLLRKGPTVADKLWLPIMLASWGIPIVITVLLVSICATTQLRLHSTLVDISFLFGEAQLVLSLVVLVISFTITATCTFFIILAAGKLQKKTPTRESSFIMPDETSTNNVKLKHARPSPDRPRSPQTPFSLNYGTDSGQHGESDYATNGVVFVDSNSQSASVTGSEVADQDGSKTDETTPLLMGGARQAEVSVPDLQFGAVSEDTGLWYRDISGKHLIRFIVLLLLLIMSSLVGILIVLWKILTDEITGIFIAINVLDTITNFGQGIYILIVFGFEKHWFWVKIYSKLRTLLFRIETVILPPRDELDTEVMTTCANFRTRYLDQCKEDILADRRFVFWNYTSVFTGSGMVDWLIEQGIAASREEGVEYGHALMMGRVLAHVTEEHYFHDTGYFYQFPS